MKRKLLLAAMLVVGALGFKANAQEDVTDQYLTNADLSSLEGWSYGDTRVSTKTDGVRSADNSEYYYQAYRTTTAVPTIEFYHAWSPDKAGEPIGQTQNFHFTQTTTLPAGSYRIAVNAFYREGNNGGVNDNKAWIFAGTKTQNVLPLIPSDLNAYSAAGDDMARAGAAFADGKYANAFDFEIAEDNTEIELGFKGYIDTYCSWCILGPVKLYKYSLDDYLTDYEDYYDTADGLKEEPMNADVKQALLDAMVDKTTFTQVSQVTSAIQTLSNAITAARVSIATYSSIAFYPAQYALMDEAGQAAFDAVDGATEALEAYNDGSIEDGVDELAVLKEAHSAGVLATVQPGEGLDMTPWITNAEATQNGEGWTFKNNAGGGNVRFWNGALEAWIDHAVDLDFNIYQNLSGLPAGVYTIGADMHNSLNNEPDVEFEFEPTAGVYGQTSLSEVYTLANVNEESMRSYVTEDIPVYFGDLTIGVKKMVDPMRGRWFAANNFKLTYVRALTDVELAQAVPAGEVTDRSKRAIYPNSLSLIENGSFENGLDGWTAGNGSALSTANFNLVEEDENHYVQAKGSEGNGDAKSIGTGWAIEEGKTYAFGYKVKANAAGSLEYYVASLANAVGTTESKPLDTADERKAVAVPANEWTNVDYVFTNTDGYQYLQFRARWLAAGQCFDDFYLIELGDDATILGNLDYIKDNVPTENIGDDLFYYSQDRIDYAMNYATETLPEDATVDDVQWYYDLMMKVNEPIEDWAYTIENTTAEGALTFAGTSVTVGDGVEVYFTPVDGGYVLSNADGEYLFKPTGNDWTLSTTANIEEAYVVNFNIVGDGEYTIQGAKGLVGTDNATAGSTVYANKSQDKNGVWTITADPFIIHEDADYDYTLNGGAWDGATFDVVLYRTIKEGINTIVLPFSMSQEEVEETFGEGSKVYIVDGFDGESNITFWELNMIDPHVPCLLMATQASGDEPYIIENRTLYSIPDAGVATGYADNLSFIGTYAASTDVENDDNNFILYNGDFYLVDTDGVTVKNTRAYFHVDSEAPIKALNFIFEDGEATAIAGIGAKKAANEAMYNVAGQRVGAAYKGIVIKNGKKYLQK